MKSNKSYPSKNVVASIKEMKVVTDLIPVMGYTIELYYAAAECLREIYTDPSVPLINEAQHLILLQFLNTRGETPNVAISNEKILWFTGTTGVSKYYRDYLPIMTMLYVTITFSGNEYRELGLLYEGLDLAKMYRDRWRYRLPGAVFD
jgi:hypothetical protein